MVKINKERFIALYADYLGVTKKEATKRVEDMCEFIPMLQNQGYDIELRGFARIHSIVQKPRRYRNPATGEYGMSEEKRLPKCSIKFDLDF